MASQVPATGGDIRLLMRRCTRVALGTLDETGAPYVSLAMVALDHDASPLLYLSDLADHSRNLKRDARISLLFDGTLEAAVPLAGKRATVQGQIERTDDARLLTRYVAHHPDAAAYAGFRDFHLYRVSLERPNGSARSRRPRGLARPTRDRDGSRGTRHRPRRRDGGPRSG